ncbi:hypothetical protein BQ8482_340213 [Mesorhizobium delmotii]|uniref:Uncharacterized protein n=1 Tax=Mesorhizobium delmotii TaxID=1631247 RepID=A0A2P9AQ83_9HYPH|nr:hypothetical protein BQ8482_340213 [Mesorhizobium delmotii]
MARFDERFQGQGFFSVRASDPKWEPGSGKSNAQTHMTGLERNKYKKLKLSGNRKSKLLY